LCLNYGTIKQPKCSARFDPARGWSNWLTWSATALLGKDVFFVPWEWETKKPLVTYVQWPFVAMKTEAYWAIFSVQDINVAVYLGKASGGLCAIDFDRDEDLVGLFALPGRDEPRTVVQRKLRGL
jgi:hypothetical protein